MIEKTNNNMAYKMNGWSGYQNSPLHMGCGPDDPECGNFRIGKQRGKKIKKWFSTARKNIGKTVRKVTEKVKNIQLPTIIKKKDEGIRSYKNPRFL